MRGVEQGRYRVVGYGSFGCDDYVVASSTNRLDDAGFENWIAGYLSGINYAWADTFDIKGDLGLPAVKDWLFSYCDQHGGDNVAAALSAFVRQSYETRQKMK